MIVYQLNLWPITISYRSIVTFVLLATIFPVPFVDSVSFNLKTLKLVHAVCSVLSIYLLRMLIPISCDVIVVTVHLLQVWRHGDRSPMKTFPTDSGNPEWSWPNGWGEL